MQLIQCVSLCVCLLLDFVVPEIYKSYMKKYLYATETLSLKVLSHRAKADIFLDACRLVFNHFCLSRNESDKDQRTFRSAGSLINSFFLLNYLVEELWRVSTGINLHLPDNLPQTRKFLDQT